MNIIESTESLISVEFDNSIIIPIYCNDIQHPTQNDLSILIFITNWKSPTREKLDGTKHTTYIIPINHPEATWSADLDAIKEKLTNKTLYTVDKKSLMYFFDCNLIDINMLEWMCHGSTLDLEPYTTPAHDFISSRFWNRADTNQIIPITKHLERVDKIRPELIRAAVHPHIVQQDYFKIYNDIVIPMLHEIEKQGLYTKNGYEYTQYNPYTTTGRPSNRFGGTNYAALNKEDGSRQRFISRFDGGKLIEMDFDAYHIRLIADVLGYSLPKGSVHEYLGKQYFGKNKLTKKEYNQSKEITFRILYGGVPKEFMEIKFFAKVDKFIKKLWHEYKEKKYILTYLFNRPMYSRNLSDMNPQKLFNYFIQSLETESNISILAEIYKVVQNYRSKLVLYTYDSFLFDFDSQDEQIFIKDVINAIRFPVKVKHGYNYNDMSEVLYEFEKHH